MHDAIVDFCAANNGETRIMAKGSGGERLDSFEGAPSPAEKKKNANKIDEWAAKIPRNAQGRSDVSEMASESIDLGRVLENHRLALGIRPEDAWIRLSKRKKTSATGSLSPLGSRAMNIWFTDKKMTGAHRN